MTHFRVALDTGVLAETIKKLNNYRDGLAIKAQEVARRLAMIGSEKVFVGFQTAAYDGDGSFSVAVEPIPSGYSVIVSGPAVAFIEFGAGVKLGQGYPGVKPAGISPIGTYGKGYGSRINGWYFTDLSGASAKTYGNPPAAIMYKTSRELAEQAVIIAKEVFASA